MKSSPHNEALEIFGVPSVLTEAEVAEISSCLTKLWELTYGAELGELEDDLKKCLDLFDPVARGHRLRERLACLPKTPAAIRRAAEQLGAPIVVEVGDDQLVVGIEARLLLWLLAANAPAVGPLVLTANAILGVERKALSVYRSWSMQRLNQVIALRAGRGGEVMQAVSVGVVLAILVNRSTTRERALIRFSDEASKQVDDAIFASATSFASSISVGRGRSQSELKLRSGYQLTEARRRLAHRLVLKKQKGAGDLIYIPEEYRAEVIDFLGTDLARRSSISIESLKVGFDNLVNTFRAEAGKLANRSMVYERAADTAALRRELIISFSDAQSRSRKGFMLS